MAQMKFNPSGDLMKLVQIASQLEQAKDVDNDARKLSQMWDAMAGRIETAAKREGEYEKIEETLATLLTEAATNVRAVATALNPIAALGWSEESLDKLVQGVTYFHAMDAYEGDEATLAAETIEKVNNLRKKTTTRNPLPTLEGKPERVRVQTVNGDKIAEQAGNKASSVGNLTAAVKNYLTNNEIEVTDPMVDQIRNAIKAVIDDNQGEANMGDFAVVKVVTDRK